MTRAAGLLILSLLCFSPAAGQDEGVDVRLFRIVNGLQNPSRDGFFEYLDHTSLPTFGAVPVGFVLVGAVLPDRRAADAGVLIAVSQVTTFGITFALKELIGRKRPFDSLSGVQVKHRWSAGGSSFPSGHTSQAFAIATLLSAHYSRLSVTFPLFLWASAIGYARVYLGVHYPSDVLAGAILGSVTAAAVWSLRAKLAPLGESLSGEPAARVIDSSPILKIVQLKIPLSGW